MVMRVEGTDLGKGGKVMVIVTRVAGKGMATTTTRAMVTKIKEVGEEEENSKGGKSIGDGEEDGSGE